MDKSNTSPIEVTNPDEYDNKVEVYAKLRLNLLKECLEMTGHDFGRTENQIEWRNYMINNPPAIGGGGFGGEAGFYGGAVGEAAVGIISINGMCYILGHEGWTDFGPGHSGLWYGKKFTDATAGNQWKIDAASVITVGPGQTNAVDSRIQPGVRFSVTEILRIFFKTQEKNSNSMLRLCPWLKSAPQNVRDAAIDCCHSGIGHCQKAGWGSVNSAQSAAEACMNMVVTAKGQFNQGLYNRRCGARDICLNRSTQYNTNYYNPPAEWVQKLRVALG